MLISSRSYSLLKIHYHHLVAKYQNCRNRNRVFVLFLFFRFVFNVCVHKSSTCSDGIYGITQSHQRQRKGSKKQNIYIYIKQFYMGDPTATSAFPQSFSVILSIYSMKPSQNF